MLTPVSSERVRFEGPKEYAMVFRASDQQVAKLNMVPSEDDLDSYVAAYFLIDGVPLVVQRYAGNEEGTYTIMVDSTAAKRARLSLSRVARSIIEDTLHLSQDDAMVWANSSMGGNL